MVVLEAYDGSAWGWDKAIVVHEGNYNSYVEFKSFSVENPRKVLDEIVEILGYKVKRRWSNSTSVFVEISARSAKRVAKKIEYILD